MEELTMKTMQNLRLRPAARPSVFADLIIPIHSFIFHLSTYLMGQSVSHSEQMEEETNG